VENDFVFFQVKATDRLKRSTDDLSVLIKVERRDLDWRLAETFPVILLVYDAMDDTGYWLYIQEQFGEGERPIGKSTFVNLRVPIRNVLTEEAIRAFTAAKAAVQARTK